MPTINGVILDEGGAVFNAKSPAYAGANDTATLQNALNAGAGGVVVIPPGVYNADGLVAPAGTTIMGYGATIRGQGGTTSTILLVDEGCRVMGLTIDGNRANRSDGSGIILHGNGLTQRKYDVEILDCRVFNCPYAGISMEYAGRVLVQGNTVTGCGERGIYIHFCDDTRVADNHVATSVNNIFFWGYEAGDPSASVSRITISGNVSLNATNGIWGSKGRHVTVTGNTVEGMADVGIDLEACTFGTIAGNTVKNITSGGITLYYGSSHVAITGNSIHQDSGYNGGVSFHYDALMTHVTVSGNSIHCDGSPALWTEQAVASDLVIEGNKMVCTGGTSAIRLLEINRVLLANNEIDCAGEVGISVEGGSDCIIAGNRLAGANAASNNGAGGILLYWRDSTFPCQRNTVRDNVVTGFEIGVNDRCWGNGTSHNWIHDNRVPSVYRPNVSGYAGLVAGNVSPTNPNTAISVTVY